MSGNSKIVDDRDANGKFSGKWSQGGVSQENNQSTTYTSAKGAQAQFSFTGTKISIYGTIASKKQAEQKHNPESTYKIDDGAETKFTGDLADDVVFKKLFFKSDDLKDGDHTLTITNQVDDGFLYIDYLEIQPATKTTSSSSSSTPTTDQQTATVITQSTHTTFIDPPTASADGNTGTNALGSGGTSTATKIAAGIFGGIVGVAFLAAIIVIALKKRRDKKRDDAVDYYANQSAWHQKPDYQ